MKCRCGIESIFCVVRDNTDYEFGPQWFFTSPGIDTFLAGALPAWDLNVIAMELEAFGIAGCDTFRELSARLRLPQCLTCCFALAYIPSSRDHVAWIKKEVLRKLHLSYGMYLRFNDLNDSPSADLILRSHCCRRTQGGTSVNQPQQVHKGGHHSSRS